MYVAVTSGREFQISAQKEEEAEAGLESRRGRPARPAPLPQEAGLDAAAGPGGRQEGAAPEVPQQPPRRPHVQEPPRDGEYSIIFRVTHLLR